MTPDAQGDEAGASLQPTALVVEGASVSGAFVSAYCVCPHIPYQDMGTVLDLCMALCTWGFVCS